MADSEVLSHIEVNTLGPLRLFKATALLLQNASTPKFVYISTLLASISGIEQMPSLTAAYGMSKAAGNYLVKKIDAENQHLITLSIDPG
jgi:norsolorinic acid ketoreductase